MNKGVILGIDFSVDYTQLAILNESNEPESLSVAGLGHEYLMPSCMFYNTELKEWSVGVEAFNRSLVEDGVFIDQIPKRMNESSGVSILEEEIRWDKLSKIYFDWI